MNGNLIAVAMTIRKGKGARFRGPYGVASAVSKENREKSAPQWVPSIRKGAARHLAAAGVPETDIARLMGHSRLDTLRRYLGYSKHLTTDAIKAQKGAAELQKAKQQ
jgi:integrase